MEIDKNIYCVWKPKSVTPNEQLESLKKQLGYKNKACFAGRLDPMASGKMIYLFDDATKLANKYMKCDKTYEFYIVCGISTDSMDCMGNIRDIKINDNISDKCNQIVYNINSQKYKNYKQHFPECSAYIAKHLITGEKKPLWYWKQINECKNIKYPNPVDIDLIDFQVMDIKIESLENYINTIINDMKNVKYFNQETIKNIIINWENIKQHSYIHMIRCMATVHSGTYIRYLVDMIGKDVNLPTHAYDITRIDIFLN